MIFDCDQRGCRSLGCEFVTSDCDWRGSLGCGGFVCVCVYVCFAWCFARQRDGFASLSFFFLLTDLGFVIVFFLLADLGFVIVMVVVL